MIICMRITMAIITLYSTIIHGGGHHLTKGWLSLQPSDERLFPEEIADEICVLNDRTACIGIASGPHGLEVGYGY
jgi:hypothetical protein